MTALDQQAPGPAIGGVAPSAAPEPMSPDGTPHRRCIVTRDVLPKPRLVRFVIGPGDLLVPDIEGRLPGRGLWTRAERTLVSRAAEKNLFAKVARSRVVLPDGLADQVEHLLARHCLQLLGLARRAGQAVAGYEKVQARLRQGGVGLLLGASDGSVDGRGRLRALAPNLPVVELFSSAELAGALGRDTVVHAAIAPGPFAARLAMQAQRLAGFRPATD